MLKASIVEETWPAGPATRPCYGAVFQHPATEHSPATFYDNYGHCLPLADTTVAASSGISLWTIVALAGVGFALWHYRKKIF